MPITSQPSSFNYTNEWSHGFCSCCDDFKSCCFAFLCFQCFLCNLHKEAGECFCTPVFCPHSLHALRVKTRANYKIDGAIWTDALAVSFCAFCAAMQVSNEIKSQGDS